METRSLSRFFLIASNYFQVLPAGGRKVLGLITLGTPNLGYPYSATDNAVFCPQLVMDMAGSWVPGGIGTPASEIPLSPFLSYLATAWNWGGGAGNGYWMAAAGENCSNPFRNVPPINSGCPNYAPSDPTSDCVVCRDSALYLGSLAQGPSPTVPWQDLNHKYVHTLTGSGWLTILVFGSASGDALPIYNPPTDGSLYPQIKAMINGQ